MPVRRALVDCAVLDVQEGRVVYPFCNHCYSRTDVQLQDYTRYACSKCGYSCPKVQVGYRYRLSLRVARETSIFGVTVFGTCLDPFFGIHASGLQRLMEEEEEPVEAATRAALLKQAIKDCFIGRHFIFGIKMNNTGSSLWFDGSGGVMGGTTTRPAQFIATQVLLPPAHGGAGCSVLSYYRALLQRAGPLGSAGSSEAFKLAAPLLLPLQSPGRAARTTTTTTTTTPPHSRLLSRSLHRLMYHDSVLSPDSPWQRSLGVVTSSAEQDTQKGEDDEPNGTPPHHHPPPNQTTAETQRAPATALPLANERGFSIGHSFTCSPWSPDTSSIAPLPPHGPPPVNQSPDGWPQGGIDAPICDPLAWEDDMAFSESLEAFIVCQENQSESRTASPARGNGHSRRRTLADVGNMCTLSGAHDATPKSASQRVSEGVCMTGTSVCGGCSCPVSYEPMGAQGFCMDDLGPVRDGDSADDVYNCSADLFSDPIAVDTLAAQELSASVGTTTVNHGSNPDPLDFIPPSQSTPLPRTCVRTGSGSAAVHWTRAASRPQPPRPPRIITTTPSKQAGRSRSHLFTASPLHCGNQRYLERDPVASTKTPTRKNHNQNLKLTSQRRLRNLDRASLTAGHSGKLQRRVASGPACFTNVSVTVMCIGDDDNNDKVVTLPTIGEMSLPVSARQGEHADGCIRQTWGRSTRGVRGDGDVHHFDQSQEFDLSRDLFADSFH